MGKTAKNTKERIVSTAWKLFYKQGYDNTTIDEIVEEAHVSKGSFYHYFEGKEALIGSIAYMIDGFYETAVKKLDESMNPVDKLVELTQEIFFMVENTVPVHLLSRVMASQLTVHSENNLLNPDRTYYRIIRQLVIEAKEQHLFTEGHSVNDIAIAYSVFERGLMYDWCISNGNYSFSQYASRMMRIFLKGFMA